MHCPSCRHRKWYCFLIACAELSEILDRADERLDRLEREATAPSRRRASPTPGIVCMPAD